MRDFFRGWRRKAGCVTLTVACLVTGMWLRSLRIVDHFGLIQGEHASTWVLVTPEGYRWEQSRFQEQFPPKYLWYSYSVDDINYLMHGFNESSRLFGFASGKRTWIDGISETTCYVIPHWFCTVPLTMLSAYLILVPSRKQPTTTSQTHA
ncbi:MAG: hypothetical protein JWP89_3630 [Schlesneria sp.]|nr:hypothetical protein [Schlesneria sp.]